MNSDQNFINALNTPGTSRKALPALFHLILKLPLCGKNSGLPSFMHLT